MILLKNKADVEMFYKTNVINERMKEYLEKFFADLQEELDTIAPDTYSVEDAGMAIVLEPNDNVRDLSNIGLAYLENGLLSSSPEWMEKVVIDGTEYYRFLILYNDAFGAIFYSPVGVFDEEIEGWFNEQLAESEAS